MTRALASRFSLTLRRRFPPRRRLLRALRRLLNRARRTMRSLVRNDLEVLLVCADTGDQKADELASRLEFFLRPARSAGRRVTVRRVSRLTMRDVVTAGAIALGDSTRVPRVLTRLADHIFDIDYERNATDGWELARLACEVLGRPPGGRALARERLRTLVRELRAEGRPCAYLFGTGPSLGRAMKRAFADGTVVVCNTIVRDEALWTHLAPRVLVAGDAIYHFGHTPHAHAFRRDALSRLGAADAHTVFIYPEIFDPIVRLEFSSVAERLIPIPIGEHTDVTVDLTRHFALPDLGNVLNLLLLPVGCTVSHDIRLWGFDGRAPSDELFWANSNRHSYPELLQTVRDAHPAFFSELVPAGREASYVHSVHGDALDEQLADAEQRGFQFTMLHFSWTPTLQKRGSSPRPGEAASQ